MAQLKVLLQLVVAEQAGKLEIMKTFMSEHTVHLR